MLGYTVSYYCCSATAVCKPKAPCSMPCPVCSHVSSCVGCTQRARVVQGRHVLSGTAKVDKRLSDHQGLSFSLQTPSNITISTHNLGPPHCDSVVVCHLRFHRQPAPVNDCLVVLSADSDPASPGYPASPKEVARLPTEAKKTKTARADTQNLSVQPSRLELR